MKHPTISRVGAIALMALTTSVYPQEPSIVSEGWEMTGENWQFVDPAHAWEYNDTSVYPQEASIVSKGWEMTGENWQFVDPAHAWEYNDHTLGRQILFTLELITAPDRAKYNAVAWAYPLDAIKADEIYDMLAYVERGKFGIAIQNSDRQPYYVLSNDLLRRLADNPSTKTQDLLHSVDEDYSVYFVSLEKMPEILTSESRLKRISSWKEASLDAQDISWNFWDVEPPTIPGKQKEY